MNSREQLLAGGESGKSIAVGHPNKSPFLKRRTTDDPFTRMPPEGLRVPADKIAILERWIETGLPWEQYYPWSFKLGTPLKTASDYVAPAIK